MTINKLLSIYEGKYTDVEVYIPNPKYRVSLNSRGFYTDYITYIDDYNGEEEVVTFEIMDKETYQWTVLSNSSIRIDDIWEDGMKMLCILIEAEDDV